MGAGRGGQLGGPFLASGDMIGQVELGRHVNGLRAPIRGDQGAEFVFGGFRHGGTRLSQE